VQALALREGLDTFPVGQMRSGLRLALGTVDEGTDADPSTGELAPMSWAKLKVLSDILAASIDDDIVLGFPTGPQVLALRPDDGRAFREWAGRISGVVPMRLRYAPGWPHGEWTILPAEATGARRIVLRFGTPPAFADWLFARDGETAQRLDELGRGLLSTITIYESGRSLLLQLDLDTPRLGEPISREVALSQLQEERLDYELAWRSNDEHGPISEPWPREAALRFVDLLAHRDPLRLEVLLYAAAHDDWISRAHVYDLMKYDVERKMTGFTKPFEGVRAKVVAEGLLDDNVPSPLVARYSDSSGWAVGLDLHAGLGSTLRGQFPLILEKEGV
jgi:hypothetical protein